MKPLSLSVNQELIKLYWNIGKYISEKIEEDLGRSFYTIFIKITKKVQLVVAEIRRAEKAVIIEKCKYNLEIEFII